MSQAPKRSLVTLNQIQVAMAIIARVGFLQMTADGDPGAAIGQWLGEIGIDHASLAQAAQESAEGTLAELDARLEMMGDSALFDVLQEDWVSGFVVGFLCAQRAQDGGRPTA